MEVIFRKATLGELPLIWEILEAAIQRRKEDGSAQWQDGYPNIKVIKTDIEKGVGYVLTNGTDLIGYSAVMVNDEPAYAEIEGQWLTDSDFVVYHRVAVAEKYLGKGFAKSLLKHIEAYAFENGIFSLKADTNFDNPAMLNLFETLGYTYCGEVFFRGASRKAFEKVLKG